jgi:hypothetical protein
MALERHEQVVHGAGAVVHRGDQAGAVAPGGARRRLALGAGEDHEARAVVRLVLHGALHHVQAEHGRGAFAGQGRDAGVGGGQARPFGVAADCVALGLGQVLGEPALALGQGLRVRRHGGDALQRRRAA